jgi:structural maintenance of chromosome 2
MALSLIVALLQFNLAPMYILNKIDATLNLSHTQHISQCFHTCSKGSQFIVVSLTEGSFTNVNVLFRAQFWDDTSIVGWTLQRLGSGMHNKGNKDRDARGLRKGQKTIGTVSLGFGMNGLFFFWLSLDPHMA